MNQIDPRPCNESIVDRVKGAMTGRSRRGDSRLPFTTLTYAQSLDGSIAQSGGGKLLLSNPQSQKMTHHVRALHDAILVGINTVVSDNPRLNVRLAEGPSPQPVVVDSRLRFPLDAALLHPPCVPPIIAAGVGQGDPDKERQLAARGARVLRFPLLDDGTIDLTELLVKLDQLQFHSLMVEGGAEVITSVLSDNLADQLLVTIATRIVGGMRAVNGQSEPRGVPWPRLSSIDYQWLADDLVLRGDLVLREERAGEERAGEERAGEERDTATGDRTTDRSLPGRVPPEDRGSKSLGAAE